MVSLSSLFLFCRVFYFFFSIFGVSHIVLIYCLYLPDPMNSVHVSPAMSYSLSIVNLSYGFPYNLYGYFLVYYCLCLILLMNSIHPVCFPVFCSRTEYSQRYRKCHYRIPLAELSNLISVIITKSILSIPHSFL